jgi:hypothetical protein
MMTHPPLQAQLRQHGRRLRGIGGISGLGWGFVVAGIVAITGAWADLILELTPALRLMALAAATLAGAAFAAEALRRASLWARPQALARRLDQLANSQGQIVSGVDLVERPRNLGPLESGLAGIAVEQAAALVSDVPGRLVVPARPILLSSVAIAALVCFVGLVALAQPRLARTLWLRFSDPFSDHPPYSAVVLRVEPGDVKVVYGQGIEIRAAVEGAAADRLELVLEPTGLAPERLPMFPVGEGQWRVAVADVTQPGRYVVHAGRARSQRFRIDVVTVPRITGARFRVTPPAYTHRSAYEGPVPSGGLTGLPGTRVEVWASSNRPLSAGTIQFSGASGRGDYPLVPTASESRDVHGTFEIKSDGKIAIEVRDVDGQPSLETFSASVVLLHDERPRIRLIEPRETSFATPDAPLPVVIAAEDDYGITRLQLFRALNGSRALPIDFSLEGKDPNRWNVQTDLPLSAYGLIPGDEIKLFARVEDNDPAGSKGSESAVATVRIIAREVFDRLTAAREGMEMLAAKYREAERRMEALAEEIERLQEELKALPPDSPLAKEHKDQLEKLARQLRQDAGAIGKSARHPLKFDIDQTLSRELESLANALSELAAEAEQLAGQPSPRNGEAAKTLADLRKKLADGRKKLGDEALEPIEHLAKIYPLLEDQARFVQLYLRQRALADRLAGLKGRDHEDDPALKTRMRDLEIEESQIRTALAGLLDDIEGHILLLPDDPRLAELRKTAEAFVVAVRTSGASEAMTEAEAGLAVFNGTQGAKFSRTAADILERLIAQCQGTGGMVAQCNGALRFRPRLGACLGNSIAQMLADAGLPQDGSGPGSAMGSGDGFSARQSNLNNVGLYGTRPSLVSSPRQGTGRSSAGGAPRGSGRPSAAGRLSDLLTAPGGRQPAGQAQAPIPLRYRRRVADYFQRVADETGPR